MIELIANLWAIYDAESGYVYALSGKAYTVDGSDEEKLTILKSLARTDYKTAKRLQVPSRFGVQFSDGTVKANVTYLNAIADPNAELFAEVFKSLERDLPPVLCWERGELVERKQCFPESPLTVVTALYEDEQGNITPIATDADRKWVAEQEELRHR